MSKEFIEALRYSYEDENQSPKIPLSQPLMDSIQIISEFFKQNKNNKLCLVLPSKEYVAQWIAVPMTLSLIKADFEVYFSDIAETCKSFKKNDLLLINNDAVVEFVEYKGEVGNHGIGFTIKYKGGRELDKMTIWLKNISKLQLAPNSRKALSSYNRLKNAIFDTPKSPIDSLLKIKTAGNKSFQKNSICIISKINAFDQSIFKLLLNDVRINEVFVQSKIDENGKTEDYSPLLISNNLSNLSKYVSMDQTYISKIIIDGFVALKERMTDFSDIDVKRIPTILITDLAEIESFVDIKNFGFDIYNFTKKNLNINTHFINHPPFNIFEKKIRNYVAFNLVKEICHSAEIESITKMIHAVENDESNNYLTSIRIALIQLNNHISKIVHELTPAEVLKLNLRIENIESIFLRNKSWLGESKMLIEESISLLKSISENLSTTPSEKCSRLNMLINKNKYDYIICSTEEEVLALKNYFKISSFSKNFQPLVISIADVNDNLLAKNELTAIIIGWVKTNNISRILSSSLFTKITVLFYKFENKYFNSLERRNRNYYENIKSTINFNGTFEMTAIQESIFNDLYSNEDKVEINAEKTFDILDFELKLETSLYSKYIAKGNLLDSIKAKRLDFENNFFVYASDSHKFLIINDLIDKKVDKINLYQRKIDALKTGDVIAFINTDKDILVELVEKNTNAKDLASVKQWTELWKRLLKDYYVSIGCDFKKLVVDLRKHNCNKHEVTIRNWLQDENIIGPDDNADLVSISLMTKSNLLNENIINVRDAIKKMKGLRMKASDFISEKIKLQMHEFAESSIINKRIKVEGLGSINVLKVMEVSSSHVNIDIKFINKLLEKEFI